jgi:hypothetical protein
MLIRLDDPTLVDDLCAQFRRSGFTAERSGSSMVNVEQPHSPGGTQAEAEVQALMEILRVMNPGQKAELIP